MDEIVPQEIPQGKHYVYTLAYPENMGGKVFYVGKGQRSRIHDHERQARTGIKSHKCSVIRKIWRRGEQIVKKKIAYFNSHAEACMYEIALILFLPDLTNKTDGGDGTVGFRTIFSPEVLRKLSEAQKTSPAAAEARRKLHESHIGRKRRAETGQKISAAKVGRPDHLSPDARKRQSDALRGRKTNPDVVRRIASANRGKKRSDETRRRMSEAGKGKHGGHTPWNKGITMTEEQKSKLKGSHAGFKHTEETRRKISEIQKGRKPSPQTIQASIEAHKGRPVSDETRQKLREANTGKTLSPETRRKISETQKGRPKRRP